MMMKKICRKYLVVFTYFFSSVVTILLNKHIATGLQKSIPGTIISIQSGIIALIIILLHQFKLHKITKETKLLHYFPASFFLMMMTISGFNSLKYLSISIFTLLKNFCIILNAVLELIIYKKPITLTFWLSVILIFASSYIGEKNNFDYPAIGYFWMAMNIFSTSLYLLLFRKNIIAESSRLNSVFYCNLYTVPQLLIFTLFTGEYAKVSLVSNGGFLKTVVLSSFGAFFTAISTVWFLNIFGSTTVSMLGAVNKIFISLSGIIFIGEKNVTPLKIIALIFGSLAGLICSYDIKKSE